MTNINDNETTIIKRLRIKEAYRLLYYNLLNNLLIIITAAIYIYTNNVNVQIKFGDFNLNIK